MSIESQLYDNLYQDYNYRKSNLEYGNFDFSNYLPIQKMNSEHAEFRESDLFMIYFNKCLIIYVLGVFKKGLFETSLLLAQNLCLV